MGKGRTELPPPLSARSAHGSETRRLSAQPLERAGDRAESTPGNPVLADCSPRSACSSACSSACAPGAAPAQDLQTGAGCEAVPRQRAAGLQMLVNAALLVRNAVVQLLLQPLIYELGRAPAACCWRGRECPCVHVCARVCTCTWTPRGRLGLPIAALDCFASSWTESAPQNSSRGLC